jgi:hypothetical protein
MITVYVHKIIDDTMNAHANKTSDATKKVVLLSDVDLISFENDGSTMDMDAFESSKQAFSSLSKGGRPTGSTSVVMHGKHQDLVDAKNFCAIAFLKLKENRKRRLYVGYMTE